MIRSRKAHKHESTGSGASANNARPESPASVKKEGQVIISNSMIAFIVIGVMVLGFVLESFNPTRGSSNSGGSGKSALSSVSKGRSLLTAEEDEALLTDKNDNDQRYHLIFSTDCGTYQHWQSYATFFRAMKVKQPGHVTRIASGCSPEEKESIEEWFNQHVQHMSKRFHLMLTPKFSEVKDADGKVIGDYKFFNKPHGLKWFLERAEQLDFQASSKTFPTTEDAIVILIDPDMSLLRPITRDFTSDRDVVISARRKENLVGRTVERGKPFAQTYGFGTQFLKLDLKEIAGEDSPLLKTTQEEGRLYYPVGPPYIGTVPDLYAISEKWTEFVPRVHKQYPHLLAEMFAFSLAAAHLELKHQLIDSLMVSDVTASGEGWELVDQMSAESVCANARQPDPAAHPLPHVIHFCQRYCVGSDWFFGKRKIPHDVFSCDKSLFEEPPDNLATNFNYKWPPNAKEKTALQPKTVIREAFMVCHLTTLLNEASAYYKESGCSFPKLEKSGKIADLFASRQS